MEELYLKRIASFIRFINTHPRLSQQLQQLNLNEILFLSTSFSEQQMQDRLQSIKAQDVRDFVSQRSVNCLVGDEMLSRLQSEMEKADTEFGKLYVAVRQNTNQGKD